MLFCSAAVDYFVHVGIYIPGILFEVYIYIYTCEVYMTEGMVRVLIFDRLSTAGFMMPAFVAMITTAGAGCTEPGCNDSKRSAAFLLAGQHARCFGWLPHVAPPRRRVVSSSPSLLVGVLERYVPGIYII